MKKAGIKSKMEISLSQGTLLCATPVNKLRMHPKAVVLITSHTAFGTTGIIVNSPLYSTIQLGDETGTSMGYSLDFGGPDDNRLSFILSIPSMPDGLRNTTYWSRNSQEMVHLLRLLNTDDMWINAYKGCLHWLPGELEEEIQLGQWWTTDEYPIDLIFKNKSDMYTKVAKKISGHFASLIDADLQIHFN